MIDLGAVERKIYSQNGEDGIIAWMIERLGDGDRFFVEIGTGPRAMECNTRALREAGWLGLWIDKDGEAPVHALFVTAENVCGALDALRAPRLFDFFSLDVDGQDVFIMDALLAGGYRPRFFVIEYNAKGGADREWSEPYDPGHEWDGKSEDFGATFASICKVAERHGYVPLGCDARGVNAFFVDRDEWRGACYRERRP